MRLDERMKELIAVGSAITANCQPCLEYHSRKALDAGADQGEIGEAIAMGRAVRQGAASKMDRFASELARKEPAGAPASGGGCGCGA